MPQSHNPLPFPLLATITFLLSISHFNPTQARHRHVIKFRSPGLYPEALTWDPSSQHFIVTNRATFHSVSDAGVVQILTTSSAALPISSTIRGLAVDHHRNRLLASVNTPEPHLAAFDLRRSSLSPLFLSPLPRSTNDVANDVTVDADGNAYITNSGQNLIYKVDINGSATILSKSNLFSQYPVDRDPLYGDCGLNGVVYIQGKGYLLVVQSNTGKMFKVDAVDGTTSVVNLPEKLTAADGMAVKDDGIVVVVSMNNMWLLKSDDSWGQGVVIDKIALHRKEFPSSVTIGGGGRVYVIYGYVDEVKKVISDGNEREWFRIEEIKWEKENEGDVVWFIVLIGLGFAYLLFWRFQMGKLVEKMDKKRA